MPDKPIAANENLEVPKQREILDNLARTEIEEGLYDRIPLDNPDIPERLRNYYHLSTGWGYCKEAIALIDALILGIARLESAAKADADKIASLTQDIQTLMREIEMQKQAAAQDAKREVGGK